MDQQPASVPSVAKQAGTAPDLWGWVEPSVWSDRMLTALVKGVKGGVWFSLIDKVCLPGNLASSMTQVVANRGAAGVDHVSTEQFALHASENLKDLQEQLRRGSYRPQPIRRAFIPKGAGSTELRPLGIPTVRDRVAQAAVVHVLEPIFERDFAPTSYGFRPGRGAPQALARVKELLAAGYTHILDADLKSYFDTIPHDRLLQRIRVKVSDGQMLRLVDSFLKAGVLEGLREWSPTAGAPQGAVLSPLLSNIYLDPLDQLMATSGLEMVRYADDFIILCRSKAEAERALELVRAWTETNGLTLHPDKTRLVDASIEAFDFLGHRFDLGRVRVRRKSLEKLKDAVRTKTRRNNGRSLAVIVADLNRTLVGWFGYFKHCQGRVFGNLDSWVRRRLRSILRKRLKLKGISRHGADEKRWPNIFFAELGLFSLKTARAKVLNPR